LFSGISRSDTVVIDPLSSGSDKWARD